MISLADEERVKQVGLVEWARSSMLSTDPPLASAEDMTIPQCAANADEAVALLREHHAAWLERKKQAS